MYSSGRGSSSPSHPPPVVGPPPTMLAPPLLLDVSAITRVTSDRILRTRSIFSSPEVGPDSSAAMATAIFSFSTDLQFRAYITMDDIRCEINLTITYTRVRSVTDARNRERVAFIRNIFDGKSRPVYTNRRTSVVLYLLCYRWGRKTVGGGYVGVYDDTTGEGVEWGREKVSSFQREISYSPAFLSFGKLSARIDRVDRVGNLPIEDFVSYRTMSALPPAAGPVVTALCPCHCCHPCC